MLITQSRLEACCRLNEREPDPRRGKAPLQAHCLPLFQSPVPRYRARQQQTTVQSSVQQVLQESEGLLWLERSGAPLISLWLSPQSHRTQRCRRSHTHTRTQARASSRVPSDRDAAPDAVGSQQRVQFVVEWRSRAQTERSSACKHGKRSGTCEATALPHDSAERYFLFMFSGVHRILHSPEHRRGSGQESSCGFGEWDTRAHAHP